MKKFTLLLAALLLFSFNTFAVELGTTATISGNASVTWGVDLDTGATGFSNAASAKITLVLTAKQAVAKDGDAVTGYITLEVQERKLEPETTRTANQATDPVYTVAGADALVLPAVRVVKAGIKFSDALSVDILGITKAVNVAKTGQGVNPGVVVLTAAAVTDLGITPDQEFRGITVLINLDGIMTVDIGVTSRFDWVAAGGANLDNYYIFYGKVSLKAVKDLTLDVLANYSMASQVVGLGVLAGYDLGIIDVKVGFDFNSNSKWQLGAGVGLILGDGKSKVDVFKKDITYREGLTIGFGFDDASKMDITAAFFDGSLIPVLDLTAIFEMTDLTGTSKLGVGVDARAAIDNITPYATFILRQDVEWILKAGVSVAKLANVNGTPEVATLTLGAEYTNKIPAALADALTVTLTAAKFIPLTDLELKWTTGDLGNKNGILTFMTKVTF